VIIAAITSCTNTSNPAVMIAAGLAGEKSCRARAAPVKPWVKTSLAPGSKRRDGLSRANAGLAAVPGGSCGFACGRLRLHDLHRQQRSPAARDFARRSSRATWWSAAVLSGNRNFEARINPHVKANYLASPPLVRRLRARRHVWTSTCFTRSRWALATTASLCICAIFWPSQHEVRETSPRARVGACSSTEYSAGVRGRRGTGASLPMPTRSPSTSGIANSDVRSSKSPYFDAMEPDAPSCAERHLRERGCWQSSAIRHDDRPHLAGRQRSQWRVPQGQLSHRARGRAARLQLLRLAARQPRGDDARHLRQRAHQATCSLPGTEGGFTIKLGRGRADDDLRGVRSPTSASGTPLA
jgi:hypothetical protein